MYKIPSHYSAALYGKSRGLPIPRPRAISLVTAVYAARIVSRACVSSCPPFADYEATSRLLSRRATRIESRPPAAVCDAPSLSREKMWETERERERETGRDSEKRTRNNQRADRTDEWDTTVEDAVRSIDGIGACNVN